MKPINQWFKQPKLLRLALVHRSYCNEHPNLTSNERLEFLGDAVLSLLISDRLYQLLPTADEGQLTARRSSLVRTTSLAEKTKILGLDKLLLLSHGEEDGGGRTNPGILADTFEAVLGALYLDSGSAACVQFLTEVFPDDSLIADLQLKDPKSLLQEKAQAAGLGTPVYQTLTASGPDHAKSFQIGVVIGGKTMATGGGSSKQRAESEAATAALAKLFPD